VLREPGLDLGWVALRRPDLRLLDAQAEGPQEAIDVRGVITDPEGPLDQRGDPRGGPDVATEAVGFGAFRQECGELAALLGRQAMGRTRGDAAAQGLFASFPRPFQPLADRSLGDPQRRGDVPLLPALLGQFPRPEAAPLAQIDCWLARCSHTRLACTFQANFTNLCCYQ
jgi:hypothetical protein